MTETELRLSGHIYELLNLLDTLDPNTAESWAETHDLGESF